MSKLLLVLCLLVATYTAEASSIQGQIEALKEAVTRIIHEAMRTVQDAIEKAKVAALDSLEKVKQKGQEVVSKVSDAFDNFMDNVDKKIAEITAAADSIDVTECTRLASAIRETALDATAKSRTCVLDKIHEGDTHVESINRIANEISQDLAQAQKAAEDCTEERDGKTSLRSLQCLMDALSRAGFILTQKVSRVVKEVAKLSWTVGTIVPSLSTCATDTTFETLYKNFEGVYKQIEHCVQEKIHEAHGTTPAL
ncbi:uncharacterized protein [Prorops nasuta]|uniref:uncharacterized protein n=1 Tax=Prorops nasuta TaxID=863751 RepID=UPI0034CDC071